MYSVHKNKKKSEKQKKKGPPTRYFQLTQTQNELHVDVPLLFRGQLGMDRNLKVNFNYPLSLGRIQLLPVRLYLFQFSP